SIPSGLITTKQEVYNILLSVPQAGKANYRKLLSVVVITDLAKDYNDLVVIVVLKELYCLGFVHLEAFIVNLEPSYKRAIYRQAALGSLSLYNVLIGVSTKASIKKHKEYKYKFDSPLYLTRKPSSLIKTTFLKTGLSF
ncbi:hypothetical protein B0J14DRAFT_492795, partial [Halenospora varia]